MKSPEYGSSTGWFLGGAVLILSSSLSLSRLSCSTDMWLWREEAPPPMRGAGLLKDREDRELAVVADADAGAGPVSVRDAGNLRGLGLTEDDGTGAAAA